MLTKKLKKFLAVLSVVSMLTGGMVCNVHADSEATTGATTTDSGILYYEDFENLTTEKLSDNGFTITEADAVSMEVATDSRSTNALKITDGSTGTPTDIYFKKSFSDIAEKLQNGQIEISFDVYFENKTRTMKEFASVLNEKDARMFAVGHFSSGNYSVDYYQNFDKHAGAFKMNSGTYYNFKYIIDLNNSTYSKYLNNTQIKDANNTFKNAGYPSALRFNTRTGYAQNFASSPKLTAYNCLSTCTTDAETSEITHATGCPKITPQVFWLDNITVKKVEQELVKSVPANNSEVTADKNISAEFAAPMVSANVTADYITVSENGTALSADAYTITLSNDKKTVEIALNNGLKNNASYTVTILKDATGMTEDTTFSFTTLDEDILYYESFDSANIGDAGSTLGFTITDETGVSATVQTDSKSSKALKVENGSTSEINLKKSFSDLNIPTSGIVEVSFDVYFENRTRTFSKFAELVYGTEVRMISNSGYGTKFYTYNSWNNEINMANGNYYTFKYVLDMNNGVYSKYLDGTVKGANLSCYSNRTLVPPTALIFGMITGKVLGATNYNCLSTCTTDAETGEITHATGCPKITPQVFWLDNIAVKKVGQELIKTTPENNDFVGLASAISAEYTLALASAKATADYITVSENGTALSAEAYEVTLSDDKKTIAVALTDGLKANAGYTVTISKDVTGMAEDTVISFTTADKNVIYIEDFETVDLENSKFSITTDENTSIAVETDSRNSKALKVTNGSTSTIYFEKSFSDITLPESGVLEISFDVYFENRTRTFRDFARLDTSNISTSSYNYNFYRRDSWHDFTYMNNGQYYNFKYVLDMDNKVYKTYLNNTLKNSINKGIAEEAVAFNGSLPTKIYFDMRTAAVAALGGGNNYKCTCEKIEGAEPEIHTAGCPKITSQVFWIDNLKISTPEFYANIVDETGAYITSLTDYEGKNVTVATNIEAADANGKTVVIAVKNEVGTLKDVYTITSEELAVANGKQIAIPSSDTENYKLEIYLWDALSGMKPLSSHKLIEK